MPDFYQGQKDLAEQFYNKYTRAILSIWMTYPQMLTWLLSICGEILITS